MDQGKLDWAQQNGVVVGLGDVTSKVVARLDIDMLLLNHPDTFNIFVLALSELMEQGDAAQIMDYWHVAGIHGLPKEYWDGVPGSDKSPANRSDSGYCAHGTVLFPTWHRPYLAMIEQTIFSKMLELAKNYPDPTRYQNAAQKFRLPYFDYFRPRGKQVTFPGVKTGNWTTTAAFDFSIPQIFTVEKIMVNHWESPDKLILFDNPFYTFDFPKVGGLSEATWDLFGLDATDFSRTQTTRYQASSQPIRDLNVALNLGREGRTNITLSFMNSSAYDDYESYATDMQGTPSSGSLEDIHGNYHLLIGGRSHMSRVAVAAFDPVFWMHHANIDRYLAIWQGVHPTSWFSSDNDADPDGQTDLIPFRNNRTATSQSFWNSDQSRNTDTFGYTYPDTQNTTRAEQVKERFNYHYAWSVRVPNVRPMGTPPADMAPLDLSSAQCYAYQSASLKDALSDSLLSTGKVLASKGQAAVQAVTGDSSHRHHKSESQNGGEQVPLSGAGDEAQVSRHWYVDVVVKRLALNGAFTIYFFIGDVDNSIYNYGMSAVLAGLKHVFAAPVEACDNCARQEEQAEKVTGTNDVTPLLLDYQETGELASLSPNDVKPFLIKNLKWRVVDVNGTEYNPRAVEGLEVSVSCKVERLPLGSVDAIYEDYPEIGQQAANA